MWCSFHIGVRSLFKINNTLVWELTCYFLAGKALGRKQMECSLGVIEESVLKGHSQGWGTQKSWGSITEEPSPPQTTGPGAVAGTWESSCGWAGGSQQSSETLQGRSQGINYHDFTLTPSDSRPCLPLAKPNKPEGEETLPGNSVNLLEHQTQWGRLERGPWKHPDIVCHLSSVFASHTPPELK